jgi:hypothetical protein
MGAAVCEDDYEDYTPRAFWRRCASQINGKIFNCYSCDDGSLPLREWAQGSKLECIGRAISTSASKRIQNISFTGTLSDDSDHDYFSSFDRVMNRVHPRRKRSNEYQVEAICKCPWCREWVPIYANCDDECPSCGITFEYRTSTESCYWTYEPEEIWCPVCEKEKIVVQAPGVEQCPRCRAKVTFERKGSQVIFPKISCECPHCKAKLEVRPYEDVVCPDCRIEFNYRNSNETVYY